MTRGGFSAAVQAASSPEKNSRPSRGGAFSALQRGTVPLQHQQKVQHPARRQRPPVVLTLEEAKALLEELRAVCCTPEFQCALGNLRSQDWGAFKKRAAVAKLLGMTWKATMKARRFPIDERGFPEMLLSVRAHRDSPGIRVISQQIEKHMKFPDGALFGAANRGSWKKGVAEEEAAAQNVEIAVRHIDDGEEVRVIVPQASTMRQVKEALARRLGRKEIVSDGYFIKRELDGGFTPIADGQYLANRTTLLLRGPSIALDDTHSDAKVRPLRLGEVKNLLKSFREACDAADVQRTLANLDRQGGETLQCGRKTLLVQIWAPAMDACDVTSDDEGLSHICRSVRMFSSDAQICNASHEVEKLCWMEPGSFFGIPCHQVELRDDVALTAQELSTQSPDHMCKRPCEEGAVERKNSEVTVFQPMSTQQSSDGKDGQIWRQQSLDGKNNVPENNGSQPRWVVVGGGKQGGILVRSGQSYNSDELGERLSSGAIVTQLGLEGNRLHYRKLQGDGPVFGWVNVQFKGRPLVELLEDATIPANMESAGATAEDTHQASEESANFLVEGDKATPTDDCITQPATRREDISEAHDISDQTEKSTAQSGTDPNNEQATMAHKDIAALEIKSEDTVGKHNLDERKQVLAESHHVSDEDQATLSCEVAKPENKRDDVSATQILHNESEEPLSETHKAVEETKATMDQEDAAPLATQRKDASERQNLCEESKKPFTESHEAVDEKPATMVHEGIAQLKTTVEDASDKPNLGDGSDRHVTESHKAVDEEQVVKACEILSKLEIQREDACETQHLGEVSEIPPVESPKTLDREQEVWKRSPKETEDDEASADVASTGGATTTTATVLESNPESGKEDELPPKPEQNEAPQEQKAEQATSRTLADTACVSMEDQDDLTSRLASFFPDLLDSPEEDKLATSSAGQIPEVVDHCTMRLSVLSITIYIDRSLGITCVKQIPCGTTVRELKGLIARDDPNHQMSDKDISLAIVPAHYGEAKCLDDSEALTHDIAVEIWSVSEATASGPSVDEHPGAETKTKDVACPSDDTEGQAAFVLPASVPSSLACGSLVELLATAPKWHGRASVIVVPDEASAWQKLALWVMVVGLGCHMDLQLGLWMKASLSQALQATELKYCAGKEVLWFMSSALTSAPLRLARCFLKGRAAHSKAEAWKYVLAEFDPVELATKIKAPEVDETRQLLDGLSRLLRHISSAPAAPRPQLSGAALASLRQLLELAPVQRTNAGMRVAVQELEQVLQAPSGSLLQLVQIRVLRDVPLLLDMPWSTSMLQLKETVLLGRNHYSRACAFRLWAEGTGNTSAVVFVPSPIKSSQVHELLHGCYSTFAHGQAESDISMSLPSTASVLDLKTTFVEELVARGHTPAQSSTSQPTGHDFEAFTLEVLVLQFVADRWAALADAAWTRQEESWRAAFHKALTKASSRKEARRRHQQRYLWQQRLVAMCQTDGFDNEKDEESSETWIVMGGEEGSDESAGVKVRSAKGFGKDSTLYRSRLIPGSRIEELDRLGNWLHYKKLRGAGPDFGWVITKKKKRRLVELQLKEPDMSARLGISEDDWVAKDTEVGGRVQDDTEEEVDEEEEFFKVEHEKELRRRQMQKEKEDRDARIEAARAFREKEAAKVRAEKEAEEAERKQLQQAIELSERDAQRQLQALGISSDPQESKEEEEVDAGPLTQQQLVKRLKPIMHDMDMENPEEGRTWIVVGDTGKGGILVRRGESLESVLLPTRLQQGTRVEELDLEGNRLHYKRLRGDGPDFGWVNVVTNDKVMMELEVLES